jgi:NAD(P)-dependent dehydrogenase (short-subunit alcohol dehydrogenase family)
MAPPRGLVHQLTRAVAIEGAPFGIRVNAICPAGMPFTNFMAAGGLDRSGVDVEEVAKHTGAMHPLGKPITAEDCAEAAVYLCSDRASNVTGVLLPVDGGYVAR